MSTNEAGMLVPDVYEGAPFHARGLTAAAVYKSDWRPSDGDGWEENKRVPMVWSHRSHPGCAASKPADDLVQVFQTSSSTPSVSTVLELGALAVGPGVEPERVGIYPLALRLPLRGPGALTMPDRPIKCRRIWPAKGEHAHLDTIRGVTMEFRVSGTGVPDHVGLYAEAFIGRPHLKGGGLRDDRKMPKEPRAVLFAADGRKVVLLPDPKRFTGELMDRLLAFAHARSEDGLDVDHRSLTGRLLGKVKVEDGDVKFASRLPLSDGLLKYEGSWFMP